MLEQEQLEEVNLVQEQKPLEEEVLEQEQLEEENLVQEQEPLDDEVARLCPLVEQ